MKAFLALLSNGKGSLQSAIVVALAGILLLLAPMLMAADIEGVRLWRAPDHTRLVLDLSDNVSFKYFTLTNPERVVIDIEQSSLSASLSVLDFGNSPIKKVRAAARNGNDLRLVLDLSARVRPNAFLLNASAQYSDRLVIDLYDSVSKKAVIKTAPKNNGRRDIIIAIDAGHGGEDPGALGPKKIREKAVVMSIARATQKLFDKQPGYRAVLVRDGDYYVGLSKRRTIARKQQADFFISIHADAFKDKKVSGGSVYTLSQRGASSASARFLAEAENRADQIGGVDLSDKDDVLASVLLDLSMTATLDSSVKAGKAILKQMKTATHLHKNTVEHANFAVLKSPDIPSVLIETGFISNPKEARRLASSSHQRKLARAIFAGTLDYFNQYAVEGTLVYWLNHGDGAETTNVASAGRSPDIYKIRSGDTLSGIAYRFSVSQSELRRYNKIKGDRIRVGQVLRIPPR
jgi:N-acetylmuramoyl-L-alanine amidase